MKTDQTRKPMEIVIAEDSPTQAEQLKCMLEEHDFRVTPTRNGREAFEAIQVRKPTLVITDVNMPEVDGYELCRLIRADTRFADLPVILLTSLSESDDIFKGLKCGADNFIVKPYEEHNLLARIHYLLANIHLHDRETVQASMEIVLGGQKHIITSSRTQIMHLLLSTYDTAVQQNRELAQTRDALVKLNEQLEEKVMERTFSLTEEISKHKQAIEKIEEQAALLDKAQDAITVRDLDGRIVFWNKGAERIYEWTRQEIVGQTIDTRLYLDPKKFDEVTQHTLKHGEWYGELQTQTKSKRRLTTEARLTLLRDANDAPKSILAIITDITEKKKIESQFLRAQRMECIGTLASGIAHDLNNILSPIIMGASMLKMAPHDAQADEILNTIEVSVKRGSSIVQQVLSFARGFEGDRGEVQIKHLIKDLENIIRGTFPKTIRLETDVAPDLWTILADSTQIHQILLNLCVNARDAMPDGGTLMIRVENHLFSEQHLAANPQAKAGPYILISVSDSGTGIPPEILEKIFDPFFTTKEVGKGTGLGLSTVMAIAKKHEGFVNVYSEVGHGTAFNIYLPASQSGIEEQSEFKPDSLPRGNGEIILVVDDEHPIVTMTSKTLVAFGYRVLTAADGAKALDVYAKHRNEIAAVLLDMMMPVLDGPATIRALVETNPAIKIVAVSGLNIAMDSAKASGLGIRYFLPKPYTEKALLKTLKSVLSQA